MNLREGVRRLALLVGAAGAILCGVLSWAQLQSNLRQRADHQRFEQLANSSIVDQGRVGCFGTSAPADHGPWEKYQTQGTQPKKSAVQPDTLPADFFDKHKVYCILSNDNANAADYTPSASESTEIKTVHFENRQIASIEIQDGQTLYPTPAPGTWSYLLIAILPVFGFFVPWAAVRAIGWMLAGFVQPFR